MAPVCKLVIILSVLSLATSAAASNIAAGAWSPVQEQDGMSFVSVTAAAAADITAGSCSPVHEQDGTSLMQVMRTVSQGSERSSHFGKTLPAESKSPHPPQPSEGAKTDATHRRAQARTQADHKKEGHQDEDHYAKQENGAHVEVLLSEEVQNQHTTDVDVMNRANDTEKIGQGYSTREGPPRKRWYPSQILGGLVSAVGGAAAVLAKEAFSQAEKEAARKLEEMWMELTASVEESCKDKVREMTTTLEEEVGRLAETFMDPVCSAAEAAVAPAIQQTCIAMASAQAVITDVGVQAMGVALAPFSGGASVAAAQVAKVAKDVTALYACKTAVHHRCLFEVAKIVKRHMAMIQQQGDQFCVDLKAKMDSYYREAGGPMMEECAGGGCTADDSIDDSDP